MAGPVSQTVLSGGVAVSSYSVFTGIHDAVADYIGTDIDGYAAIHMTTGAADKTYTPPAASAANKGRRIRLFKVDSGAGGLAIAGTISGSASNNTIKARYGYAEIVSNGTTWQWAIDIQEKGTFTPVPTYATPTIGAISLQDGRYTRSGRQIAFIVDTAWRLGTASSTFTITGLPYSALANNAVAIGWNDWSLMASTMVLYAYVSTTIINFVTKLHGGSANAMQTATNTQFPTTGSDMRLFLSGTYGIA